jgi:hypothetical protein
MDRFSKQPPADLARPFRLVLLGRDNRTPLTATCSTCDTFFTVDKGSELPTIKCADPNCPVLICPCCVQFQCDGCGQTFCLEHAIEEQQEFECSCIQTDADRNDASWCFEHNADLRPRALRFCPSCFEEVEQTNSTEVPKLAPVLAVGVMPRTNDWVVGGAA